MCGVVVAHHCPPVAVVSAGEFSDRGVERMEIEGWPKTPAQEAPQRHVDHAGVTSHNRGLTRMFGDDLVKCCTSSPVKIGQRFRSRCHWAKGFVDKVEHFKDIAELGEGEAVGVAGSVLLEVGIDLKFVIAKRRENDLRCLDRPGHSAGPDVVDIDWIIYQSLPERLGLLSAKLGQPAARLWATDNAIDRYL